MPYSYLEHISDVGTRAEAETLDGAFESGAEAMLNLIFDLSTITVTEDITFGVEAGDLALTFVETLNEILFIIDRHSLALTKLKAVQIKQTDGGYLFTGTVLGEPFDLEKHTVKTEVKAATYSGLSYKESEGKHVFECVLDV